MQQGKLSTRRVRPVFHDDARTLFAVESLDTGHSRTTTVCQLYGTIRPVAIVVCGRDETFAVDMEAHLLDLEQLVLDVPELDAYVAPARGYQSGR